MALSALSIKAQINADGVIKIGRNALYYEDYALSIQYFNQAIAAKPYLYAPYYFRAIAKYYLGDYAGAISDCSASIERDPYITEVYRLRAINYIRTDNFEAASKDYKTLIDTYAVKDRDVWYNLVLCESQLKNYPEASRVIDSMIVKWPSYARCYMLKAQISIVEGDTLLADSLMNRTLQLDADDVDAWSGKALLCLQRAQYSEAEKAYDEAIMRSPRQSGFYVNRALARYQQKNLRGAMDDYNAALELAPNSYLAHYNRALLRMQVGENNLALEDFDFVLEKHPDDRLALYNHAILSQQTGDFKQAIRDYTTVLKDYPDFGGAYVNRAYCYRKVGDNRRAEADDRKSMQITLNQAYTHKTYASPYDAETRNQSESDIEDYDKMVTDDDDNIAAFYEQEYRGKVQNREVAVEYQPLYALTFNGTDNGLFNSAAVSKANFLDNVNANKLLANKVLLSPKEEPMSEEEFRVLSNKRSELEEKLGAQSTDSQLLFVHALYLTSERDYESALQDLNQCLDHSSNSLEALFLRAVVRYRLLEIQMLKHDHSASSSPESIAMGRKSVIADLTNAIELEDDCAYLYYNRGCVYSVCGEHDNAIADYTKAIELNPSFAEAYYNRGIAHMKNSDKNAAIQDLSRAGELGLFTSYSLIKHFRSK